MEIKLSFSQIILGGVVAMIVGFLGAIGADTWSVIKPIVTTATISPSITVWQILSFIAIGIGILSIIGGYSAKQRFKLKKKQLVITPEEKLDDLLFDLRQFIKDWHRRHILYTGYRRLIENRGIWQYQSRMRKQSQRIQGKIKPIQELKIANSEKTFDDLGKVADRLVDLGVDIEFSFQSLKLEKQTLKDDPTKLQKLIIEGDKICKDLLPVICDLEKFRKVL